MTSSKKPAPKPWHPAPYADADSLAIKALHEGNANQGQQQRALKWIIETLCGTYDQPFRPGEDGRRETDFACGKMFVGQQIVKQIKLPMPARMSR